MPSRCTYGHTREPEEHHARNGEEEDVARAEGSSAEQWLQRDDRKRERERELVFRQELTSPMQHDANRAWKQGSLSVPSEEVLVRTFQSFSSTLDLHAYRIDRNKHTTATNINTCVYTHIYIHTHTYVFTPVFMPYTLAMILGDSTCHMHGQAEAGTWLNGVGHSAQDLTFVVSYPSTPFCTTSPTFPCN